MNLTFNLNTQILQLISPRQCCRLRQLGCFICASVADINAIFLYQLSMFKVTSRFFYSNLKNFTILEQLNAYLGKNRFTHTVVYFRAGWNPQCEIADQQLNKLAAENRFLQVIKVDSDASPKIARHYGVKNQPEFVFCLYGDEVLRQIGPNQQGLSTKLDKMVKLGAQTDNEFVAVEEKWSPYGTRFQRYYMSVLQQLYDRNVSDL